MTIDTTDWDEVALHYGTDKASSFHSYMFDYHHVLGSRQVTKLLEIGVSHGSSLFMWRDIFPGAEIVGIDILPECRLHQRIDIDVLIADAADPAKMAAVSTLYGPFDVIIDDGSHQRADIMAAFEELYPRMAKDGVYIVEDLLPEDPWTREWADRWGGRVLAGNNGSLVVIERRQ
jgi:cephalosporin hydroxylase